jgi:hypothetical protein
MPIPSAGKKFRTPVFSLFIFFVVMGWLVGFAMVLMMDGFNFDRRALVMSGASVMPLGLLAAWGTSLYFTAVLSAEGIHGHSFWGSRRFIRWQDMAEARTFTLLNLRWLRVYSDAEGRVTWLALSQARKREFVEELRRLAPPSSPVLKHLG